MTYRRTLKKLGVASTLPLALSFVAPLATHAQKLPTELAQATSVSPENTNKVVEATVWLKLHNKAGLDAAVEKLYEPGSPTYHKWMTTAELAKYNPTAAEVATVKNQLAKEGLTVTSVDENNLSVKTRGTVGQMQSAFNTKLSSFQVNGQAVRAATVTPSMSGAAQTLVSHVSGLTQQRMQPYLQRAINPETGRPFKSISLAKAKANGIFYSGDCFTNPAAHTFTSPNGALPVGTYYGNGYGAPITNTQLGTLSPCGYSASQVQAAYGMSSVYQAGFTGQGQTIVIVDAWGSQTIQQDANIFSQLNGLPALDSSNFQIYQPSGPPDYTDPLAAGWVDETSIDVEWAHAMAPNAKIVLLEAATNSYSDLQAAVAFGITRHLGNNISNSYGSYESGTGQADLEIWNALSEFGAALGISVNFSSGDSGDFAATSAKQVTVSVPSDSPYATSVGGTTVNVTSKNQLVGTTGWGNNYTRLTVRGTSNSLPAPINFGFIGGAGGGQSAYFAKPGYQSGLPGTGRQQPDVSAIADPYTGVEIISTNPANGVTSVSVYGGTSVACPVFSGIWALANQAAGRNLGQAAPIVSRMSSNAVSDVLPISVPTNPAGVIFNTTGPTYYSQSDLVQPLQNTTSFFSALWNASSGSWYVLSFGTDSSLVVAPGWDNVTGYGTPNGLAFVQEAGTK